MADFTAPVVHVRPGKQEDYESWFPLYKGYQEFYKADLSQSTQTTWERFFTPTVPVHLAVAEINGKVIGITHYIEHYSCWSTKIAIYLQDLFVDPQVRGSGAGRKLIEFVFSEAKRLDAYEVHWLTHETNETAQFLYDKITPKSGFIDYSKTID